MWDATNVTTMNHMFYGVKVLMTSMQIKHTVHAGNLASVPKTKVHVKCIGSIKHVIVCSNFASITFAKFSVGRIRRRQDSINRLSIFQRINLIHSVHAPPKLLCRVLITKKAACVVVFLICNL